MGKRWTPRLQRGAVNQKIDDFLYHVGQLCQQYQFTLSIQPNVDFRVTDFNKSDLKKMMEAHDLTNPRAD